MQFLVTGRIFMGVFFSLVENMSDIKIWFINIFGIVSYDKTKTSDF